MKDWLHKNLLDLVQTIVLAASLLFAGVSFGGLTSDPRNDSATLVLQASNYLDKPQYAEIRSAIGDNPSSYPLLSNGFTKDQIESYIGQLDTVGYLLQDDIITKRIAYDLLSFDAAKAWCNSDVQKVIGEDREKDGTTTGTDALYSGLERLATDAFSTDKTTCTQMDAQG